MSRHSHPRSTAKCLVLAALLVGLYRLSQPPTPPAPSSALGKALAAGDIPAACFLLQAGTDVDQHGICRTPLHQAALLDQTEVVRILLDKGAEIDPTDDVGQTPLFAAASLGNETVAEALLQRGANLHARDHAGRTPLHWAAASGREEMAALLIEYGADPTARDASGKSPLALAPPSDYPYLARLFKRTNAKPAL